MLDTGRHQVLLLGTETVIRAEIAVDQQAICRTTDGKAQVIAFACQYQVIGGDPLTKTYGILDRRSAEVIDNRVLSITQIEQEGIDAIATVKRVIARATGKDIVAIAALQVVVSAKPVYKVVLRGSSNIFVSFVAVDAVHNSHGCSPLNLLKR
nr:hypothetical protein [Massilia sp. CF038]